MLLPSQKRKQKKKGKLWYDLFWYILEFKGSAITVLNFISGRTKSPHPHYCSKWDDSSWQFGDLEVFVGKKNRKDGWCREGKGRRATHVHISNSMQWLMQSGRAAWDSGFSYVGSRFLTAGSPGTTSSRGARNRPGDCPCLPSLLPSSTCVFK